MSNLSGPDCRIEDDDSSVPSGVHRAVFSYYRMRPLARPSHWQGKTALAKDYRAGDGCA